MTIYLLTFVASSIASYGSDKLGSTNVDKNKLYNFISIILMLIAVLSVSILAGCRDYSIGTDVLVYGNQWFQNAVKYQSDPSLYLRWATSSSIGYFYALFNYIVARFTNNPHWFYFWYSFAENIVIYWAIRRNKDIISPFQGWLVYLFLFYNSTLNVLRNWMALAIVLWGFKYIRERKLIKYLITAYVAYLFHNSAYIALVPYFVNIFLQKSENDNQKLLVIQLKKLVIVFFTVITVILFSQIVNFLALIGVVNTRYQEYTQLSNGGGFLVHLIVLSLPVIVLYMIQHKLKGNKNFELFEMYAFIMMILGVLNRQYTYLSRITLYFDVYLILSIPFVIKNGVAFNFGKIKAENLMLIAYLVFYWLLIYGFMKSGETVPYIFMRG